MAFRKVWSNITVGKEEFCVMTIDKWVRIRTLTLDFLFEDEQPISY